MNSNVSLKVGNSRVPFKELKQNEEGLITYVCSEKMKVQKKNLENVSVNIGGQEIFLKHNEESFISRKDNLDKNPYNLYKFSQLITSFIGSNKGQMGGDGAMTLLLVLIVLGGLVFIICTIKTTYKLLTKQNSSLWKCLTFQKIGGFPFSKKGKGNYGKLVNENENEKSNEKISPMKMYKTIVSTSYFEIPMQSQGFKCFIKVKFSKNNFEIPEIVLIQNDTLEQMEQFNTNYYQNLIQWMHSKYPDIEKNPKFQKFMPKFEQEYYEESGTNNTIPLLSNFN